MAVRSLLCESISLLCVLYITNADYKNCTRSRLCEYTNPIDCIHNEDCIIDCSGYYGCLYSVINCPLNSNCIIQCSNQYSCKGLTVNASPNTILNITCNGENEACRDSIINGNINTEMNIKCANAYACYGAVIDGRHASKLHMIDCATDFWTCYMLTIYCPENINGDKRCIVEGDNSFGGEYNNPNKQEPIHFYAINSWNDIEFKTKKTDDFYGTMHCMTNYSETCSIAQCCGWKCINMRSICQNPPTLSPIVDTIPTQYPTSFPTVSPSKTTITTFENTLINIGSTEEYNEHSVIIQYSTSYNKDSGNDNINHSETLFTIYSKYIVYIIIAIFVYCCIICFECWYFCGKRQKKKSKFKHISIEQNNSDETQMISKEGYENSINKQTNVICCENYDLSNDMEIIGDDEYNENAIITKQPTFENAENDEEVMSDNYTKKDTISVTVMSEGDVVT